MEKIKNFKNSISLEVKVIILIILIALLIRLLIMPFSMHADFLSSYWRANVITSGSHFILNVKELLAHYILAVYLWFMDLFGLINTNLFYKDWGFEGSFGTTNSNDLIAFFQNDIVYRFAFLGKIPYLIAEFIAFIVLVKTFPKYKLFITILFWANFYSLFANIIYGRYEIFAIVPLYLSIYFLNKDKKATSLAMLILTTMFRSFYIYLIPIWLVVEYKWVLNMRNILKVVLILSTYAIMEFLISNYGYIELINRTPDPSDDLFIDTSVMLIKARINNVSIFIAGYIFLLLSRFHIGKKFRSTELFAILSLAAVSLYFAVNSYSVHYISWLFYIMIPAFIVLRKYIKAKYLLLLYFIITVVSILSSWVSSDPSVFLPSLLRPLDQRFGNIDMKYLIIDPISSLFPGNWGEDNVIILLKSTLSGLLFYLIYLLFNTLRNGKSRADSRQ